MKITLHPNFLFLSGTWQKEPNTRGLMCWRRLYPAQASASQVVKSAPATENHQQPDLGLGQEAVPQPDSGPTGLLWQGALP